MFMRLGMNDFGMTPTAGMRVTIGAIFLLPIIFWKGHTTTLVANWKKVFFIGILNSALPFVCISFALQTLGTSLLSVLNATVPLFGALVAWVWLKDRPNSQRILGLSIGFLGITMLAWNKVGIQAPENQVKFATAVLSGICACISYGISASYTRKYLTGLPSLVTATGSQIGASLCLLPFTYWLWPIQSPSWSAWIAVLFLGIVCSGIAYMLFFRLIETIGPARALTVTFAVPVFASFYGVVFLDEHISAWMLMCAGIIICGSALSAGLFSLKK